ncbi:MAG TPA: hypothetical protein VNI61_07480 [Gemmatimonadales bacterium]|nr:hypothetical protein [Gemmatimonadales bacterium]
MTAQPVPRPLRLLLVTESLSIPSWLATCLAEVERTGRAHVVLIWPAGGDGARRAAGRGRPLARILFRLHQRLDRWLFRRSPDALALVDVRAVLPNRRVLAAADGAALAQLDPPIDVILDPFSLLPDAWLEGRSRYGVWRVTFGRSGDPATPSLPAFREVVEGVPVTEARLHLHDAERGGTRSLYLAVTPTDRRSVSRTLNHAYWKLAAALVRKLQLLAHDRAAFEAGLEGWDRFRAIPNPSPPPDTVEVLRGWSVLVRRYLSDKWLSARYRDGWVLAYQHGAGEGPAPGPFRQLLPPADRLWADPFPIRVGNEYYVFHEELRYSTEKGVIVVTVLDERGAPLARAVPVLETDCHLSYPCVFAWDGDLFMIPETASRDRVELYRCTRFPSEWKPERVLLSGIRAFDATPALLCGRWWLFATVATHGTGSTDQLHVFYADSPLGPWTPHPQNPVKDDVRSGRPAGRVFERGRQSYRPAQDCSRHYGYAISINRIVRLDPECYHEVEVDRILPDPGRRIVGIHTLNQAGDLTVMDYLLRRRRW